MTSPESPPAAPAPASPVNVAGAGAPEPFPAPRGDDPARGVPPDLWGRARSDGLVALFSKYSTILRVSLSERMTYRADFLLGTVLRFLPLVTTILLWQAVYEGSGRSDLEGFRYR